LVAGTIVFGLLLALTKGREVQEGDTRPSMKIYYQRTDPVSK
jgi:hypothetical protein